MSTIEDRAAAESRAILAYFANLEALGKFAGAEVDEGKHAFLALALVNFARREARLPSEGSAADRDAPGGQVTKLKLW